jgi:hypothetical protein
VLFEKSREVSAKEIGEMFGFQQRTAAALCQRWVEDKFLIATNSSNKARRYRLADAYEESFSKEW